MQEGVGEGRDRCWDLGQKECGGKAGGEQEAVCLPGSLSLPVRGLGPGWVPCQTRWVLPQADLLPHPLVCLAWSLTPR